MCTYLAKRGATYYFRRPVPVELRPYLDDRGEWMVSLRSKDRETAKRAIPEHTIATDALLEGARASLERGRVARAAQVLEDGGDSGGPSAGETEEADFRFDQAWEAGERWKARRENRARLRDRLANRRSNELHLDEQAFRDILREREAAHARYVARMEREGAVDVAPVFAAVIAPVPLLEIFDAYAKEQQLKPTTVYEWRRNIGALVQFLGHDDAKRMTIDDLDRWRDKLLAEVTKRGTLRSPRTVKDKYFAALRATLNWAVEKRRLDDNLATRVVVRVPKRVKLRERDFTTVEAMAILVASIQPSTDKISAYQALARRWVPWLCSYTGARVAEIGQLRGSDVTEIDGFWTLRITPEAGTQKANTARIVPLHPHLIEQGFLAVSARSGNTPMFYDPTLVRKPSATNRHAKKVGERLAEWVRDQVGITDREIQPNHGWRHTFKTMTIEAGIPERVADAIQGHAPRSVGQTYGSVSLKTLAAAVASMPRYEVPGLTLPAAPLAYR